VTFPQTSFRSGIETRVSRVRALTLSELLVTVAVFSVVIVGVVELHLFGLHQNQIVESKLGASDQARISYSRLIEEIRAAKMWQIGNGSESGFTAIPNGTPQQGSALQLYPTASTNSFIRYYFDNGERQLRRVQSGVADSELTAEYLSNDTLFQAEDHRGSVKTDLSYKYVIRVRFEFFQYEYPRVYVGPGQFYDYYKLEFRVTPHCPDGA
jgi:hypothetical protein